MPRAIISGSSFILGGFSTPVDEDDMKFINEQLVGGAGAATVTFSSIPQTYRHLELIWTARCDNGTGQTLLVQFNGDSGNNYDFNRILADGTTLTAAVTTATSSIRVGSLPPTGAPAAHFASGKIRIPYYTTTTQDKVTLAELFNSIGTAAGDQEPLVIGGHWRTTNAGITSMVLFSSTGNLIENSRFSLYGIL